MKKIRVLFLTETSITHSDQSAATLLATVILHLKF